MEGGATSLFLWLHVSERPLRFYKPPVWPPLEPRDAKRSTLSDFLWVSKGTLILRPVGETPVVESCSTCISRSGISLSETFPCRHGRGTEVEPTHSQIRRRISVLSLEPLFGRDTVPGTLITRFRFLHFSSRKLLRLFTSDPRPNEMKDSLFMSEEVHPFYEVL